LADSKIVVSLRGREGARKIGKKTEYNPSGAKAHSHFAAYAARLKPCPFKAAELPEA
jgi:hypothetical protein